MLSLPTLEVGATLKNALSLYKDNWAILIGISFVANLPSMLVSVINSLRVNLPSSGFMYIAVILVWVALHITATCVMFWGRVALILYVSNIQENRRMTWKECFSEARPRYWGYLIVNFTCFLIAIIGFLLFLIPGFYWGTIIVFAGLAVVLEGRKDVSPFEISRKLVKGSFWKVLVLGIITSLLPMCFYWLSKPVGVSREAAVTLNQLIHFFYTPFSLTVLVLTYLTLKRNKEGMLFPGKKVDKGYGCAILLGLLIAFGLILSLWLSGVRKLANTENGSRAIGFISKTISPDVRLPDNVKFGPQENWFVTKVNSRKMVYTLWRPANKKITRISLWLVPLQSVDGPETATLDNNEFARNVLRQSPRSIRVYRKECELARARTIEIGDQSWGEHVWERKKWSSGSVAAQKIICRVYKGHVLVFHYRYRYRVGDDGTIEQDEEILKDEESIRRIIASLRFP